MIPQFFISSAKAITSKPGKVASTLALLLSLQAHAAGTLYLVEDSSNNTFYTVDTTTAVPTLVGAGNSGSTEGLALSSDPSTLFYGADGNVIVEIAADGSNATLTTIDPDGDRGLTFISATGLLYGADNGDFEEIDPVSGTITPLASTPGGEDVEGLAADEANNVIYGIGNDEVLYAYDVLAGTWSTIGATGVLDGNDIGLAFDPTTNTLLAVNEDGILYSITPATGATVEIGDTGLGTNIDVGLAFVPAAAPPAEATAIPTSPQWSIILLAMLLALAGFMIPRKVQR